MEQKFYIIFRKSIAARLLLLFSLLVGGGNSVWAQKSLPYSYGFENNDLATEGWTKSCETVKSDESDAAGIYNSKSYPGHSSSTYLYRFYGNTVNQYLISPLLATSATGIDVSFYYNSFTGTQPRTFNVGYSITDTEVSSFTWLPNDITYTEDGWIQFQESFPTETKYIAIRHKANSQYQPFFIDDFSVEAQEQYKAPRNLVIDAVTSSSATLSWTNGRDETAWEIAYSTDADFNPASEGVKVSVDSNPTTLTGLVQGVTYYAYVRANYSGTYSEWSSVASFQPQNEVVLNGSASSTWANIPIPNYTNNSSYLTKSQIIIPYSELSDAKGYYITQLTFYATSSTIDWGTATYDVYLAETATSYFGNTATFIDWENCTKVMENTSLSVSDGKLVLNLSTPFLFSGSDSKNLLIGFQQKTVSSSSVSSYWYTTNKTPGTSKYYCAAYYNSGSYTYSTGQSYVPKVTMATMSPTTPVTLGTSGYTTFACPRPLDLANLPSGLKAYKASVTGTTVRFSEVNQAVPANTGVLLKGEADQTYDIPFSDSGSALGDNAFEVNSTGGTFSGDGDYTYFGLIKNSNPLTFGEFAPSTVAIPTNKAYLKVLTSSLPAESRQLTFLFDENETTAIKDLPTAAAKKADDAVFSITGQRVSTPTKGLYIINGKKYIIK